MFVSSSSSQRIASLAVLAAAATSAVCGVNGESSESTAYLRRSSNAQHRELQLGSNLIPEKVLEVIPMVCRDGDDAQLSKTVDCAVGNLLQCSGLLGVMDQFESLIPTNADDITSCRSIEEPFCDIATKCKPCIGEFEKLARCIVENTESGVIDQSILDLIDTCSLTCDGSSNGGGGGGDEGFVIEVDEESEDEEEEPVVIIAPEVPELSEDDNDGLLDIPATAIEAGNLDTLVTALYEANLVGALSDPDKIFTVFAPSDDAFNALPDGLLGCLLNDIPTLSNILLYHVANGKVLSTQLTDGMEIETLLNGTTVVVDLSRGGVSISGSTVTTPDVLATNGVVHIINEVLVPPGVDIGAYLATCTPSSNTPEIDNDVDESESEEDNDESNIDDFLGGIVDVDGGDGGDNGLGDILPDDVNVDSIGDAVGSALGNVFGEDVGTAIGDAVGNFLGGLMEQINNGSGWFGGNGGSTGGWFGM